MNTVEIADKKNQLVHRNLEILSICKQEARELTAEEEQEFKANEDEISELDAEKEKIEKELENLDDIPEEEEKSKTNTKISRDNKMKNSNYSLIEEIRSSIKTGEQIRLDRAYTVTSEGEDLSQTDVYNVLEPLRAKLALVEAGAHFISNVKGDLQIPVMTAGQCAWAGETADASDGAGSFTNVTLSPNRLTAYCEVSLQLIQQDTVGAEDAIRNDLVKSIAEKIESTVLSYNAGSSTMPAGLAYNVAYTTVADYGDLCDLEAALEEKNVYGDMHYILSPKAKATLRSTIKGTNNSGFIMEQNEVDGVPAVTTSNVPSKYFYYGDFNDVWVATWSDVILDVVRDSASLKKGCITLVVNMYVDAKAVRPDAIAVGKVS